MGIRLGVDLGTTYTAAAVSRDGDVEIVRLGSGTAVMPSVVAFDGDDVLVGADAERRLAESPTSGAREFKRRLGDTTPYVLDGVPHGAESLTGHLLRGVVERVGQSPDVVCVTHPANWGEYKLELLRDAGRLAGVGEVELLAEPAAAALHYAGSGKLDPGAVVAVYDFGGGTFDAAVVRIGETGAEVIGRPEGLERLGGVDIDQVVLAHVDAALDGALAQVDTSDPEVRRSILALRAACTEAKEGLSGDTDVTIPVRLPSLVTEVRMTRAELEAAIDARLGDTMAALDRAIASADVTTDDLAGVLLAGGSSRIPAVAERLAGHTGRPVLADADHETIVAAGAAGGADRGASGGAAALAAAGAGAGAAAGRRQEAGKDEDGKQKGGRLAAGLRGAPLGTVGRAAAAVGAIGVGGAGSYAAWRYLRDDDGGEVIEEVELAAATRDIDVPIDGGLGSLGDVSGELAGIADSFTPTPQGRMSSAVFRAAASRPAAPVPRRSAPAPTTGGDEGGGPAPTSGGVASIVSDPRVEDVRTMLRERLDDLAVPEGADPEDVARLHEDLDGLLDRFQPYPGQSVDDAIAALRFEFEDRVRDFAQDQRIDAVIEEQRRQLDEAREVEAELSEYKDQLRERLENWEPPAGADPEEVDALRAQLEGMIDRAIAVPGQSAEDAIADLQVRFTQEAGDFAQDLKIDALVEERRGEDDEDATDEDEDATTEDRTDEDGTEEDATDEDEDAATEDRTDEDQDATTEDRTDEDAAADSGSDGEVDDAGRLTRDVPIEDQDGEITGPTGEPAGGAMGLADELDVIMSDDGGDAPAEAGDPVGAGDSPVGTVEDDRMTTFPEDDLLGADDMEEEIGGVGAGEAASGAADATRAPLEEVQVSDGAGDTLDVPDDRELVLHVVDDADEAPDVDLGEPEPEPDLAPAIEPDDLTVEDSSLDAMDDMS